MYVNSFEAHLREPGSQLVEISITVSDLSYDSMRDAQSLLSQPGMPVSVSPPHLHPYKL